ncbi:MAG TPA: sugar transferase [Actinomycetes bacterium]|nr:sugar transferase [Actinomycetes bacterium]
MHHRDEPLAATGDQYVPGRPTTAPDRLTVVTQLPTPSSAIGAGAAPDPRVASSRDYARLEPFVQAAPKWLPRYTITVIAADLAAAIVAAVIAISAFPSGLGSWVAAIFPPAWVGALALGRTYEHRFVGNGSEEYKRLFHTSAVFLAVVGTVAYALDLDLTRGVVVVGLPVAMVLSLVVHWAARQGLHRARRSGECMQRAVVVGLERSVAELVRTVRREPHAGLEIVGACIDRPRGSVVEDVPVLGDSDHVMEVLAELGADTVAVTAWSDVSQNDLRRLSWDLEGTGVTLLVAPRLTDISGPRIHIRPVAGLPLLNIEEPEFTGVRRIVKGGMDRLLAIGAVVLLSPVFLALALLVKLTSSGPVLFNQVRIGRHGRPFVIHKFRSMYVDAEERLASLEHLNDSNETLFKMRNDPRVTPVGRFLRRFSLDELPQFFDVLLGRMSLVGPRPPLPCEVERYASLVRRRLVVKPGITGLWQVSGRSDLSWDESVRLDLLYVETWSLALDVAIMLKTVLAVLRRRGAY